MTVLNQMVPWASLAGLSLSGKASSVWPWELFVLQGTPSLFLPNAYSLYICSGLCGLIYTFCMVALH